MMAATAWIQRGSRTILKICAKASYQVTASQLSKKVVVALGGAGVK
jgi:hypothetical protein